MTAEMNSPSGLDMYPQPPTAVRVRRSVGIFVLVILVLVVLAVVYGIFDRQRRQMERSSTTDAETKATPATTAGREVMSNIFTAEGPLRKQDVPMAEGPGDSAATNVGTVPLGQFPQTQPPRTCAAIVPRASPSYEVGPERPEERERAMAYEKEQEAIEASTSISGSGREYSTTAALNSASPVPASATPSALTFPGLGAPAGVGGGERAGFAGVSQTAEYNAQNAQDQKAAYFAEARKQLAQNYLPSVRAAPISRFEVKAGWDIPAILEQAINSDEPGEIKCLVRENVYDTATGKYLLFPQGARLIGSYNSQVSYSQDGIQVVWERVMFPDGSSLNLNGMIGQDAQGQSGLRFAVDHHYPRLLGFAVLTSVFSAGFQLSQNRPGTILATPSAGEVVAGAVGNQVSQLGVEITRRNLNVQPTIKIPAGYRFNIRVDRDLVFEAPYSPL